MNNKKKIILAICVLAFMAIIVFGYKWIIEKPEGNEDGSQSSGGNASSSGGGSGSGSASSTKTNNENPTIYEVGDTLFTYGEYAIVRENPCINDGLVNNKIGEVHGLIGTIKEIRDDSKGGTHKWYRVKLATPIERLFIENQYAFVRDDVVTNNK